MLLRSSSAPILNSWLPTSLSSPEPDAINLHLPRTKSVSLSTCCHLQNPSSEDHPSTNKLIFSSSDHHSPPKPKRQSHKPRAHKRQQEPQPRQTPTEGGDDRASEATEAYYAKMIEANPGNSLVLANYAKFLKEVRGDYARAEEYCGRAILADPNDGDALAFYADLIWIAHKDRQRAEDYFDQAVKASPDDCYVLASYAKFLWDDEDEEIEVDRSRSSESTLLHGENLTA